MKRVVVTGLGMINSLGHDKESSFQAIVAGKCGIRRIELFDPTEQSAQIAGEVVDFDPNTVMDAKEVKKADRFIQLGLKAAKEAMADASLPEGFDASAIASFADASLPEGFDTERFDVKSFRK